MDRALADGPAPGRTTPTRRRFTGRRWTMRIFLVSSPLAGLAVLLLVARARPQPGRPPAPPGAPPHPPAASPRPAPPRPLPPPPAKAAPLPPRPGKAPAVP